MQSSQFVKVWFLSVISIIIMIASLNYFIDPFGVFHSGLFTKSKSLNERVVKIDYLSQHKARYNAFMLGSSTMGTTDPKALEKYVKGSHFYNLTCSSSNMYDFKVLIKYLLESGYEVKNLYMQIDLTSLREYGKHPSHGQKHHYLVNHQPAWQFYLEYLTIFPYEAMKAKVFMALEDANATEFDIENSGMWFVRYKDKARAKDIDAYIQNEHSFRKKSRRTRGIEKNFDMIISDYQEIVKMCKAHDVNLTVLTTAYNHLRLDAFKIEDVLHFIKALATYHDIWVFSDYNSITNDDKNYYEVNHFIPKVGALKAAKIYHDTEVFIPEDFGCHVTKEHIDACIERERENFLSHDKQR
jgi:hypothetical protein